MLDALILPQVLPCVSSALQFATLAAELRLSWYSTASVQFGIDWPRWKLYFGQLRPLTMFKRMYMSMSW